MRVGTTFFSLHPSVIEHSLFCLIRFFKNYLMLTALLKLLGSPFVLLGRRR